MSRRRRADILAVFVKAPVAGRVKTRLAAKIGAQAAADLYRALGRSTVSACLGETYQTAVWFTPSRARRLVRGWLDDLPVAEYRAQRAGILGSRLSAAFRHHFQVGATRVVLIGSDCPGIDAALVSRAFGSLSEHDLVLGPAHDGGYYLIGLRRPEPRLFRGVDWSTDAVLAQTLSRAARLKLHSALLPRLRDIDTPEDAIALGLLDPRRWPAYPFR
jgi:uncharacterized protein